MLQPARVRLLLLTMLVVVACGSVAYFFWPRSILLVDPPFNFDELAPDNPQLTFATPFRNVKPDVKYVGDDACLSCHKEIHESFHNHPMGRSATFTTDPKLGDRYDAATRSTFKSPEGRDYKIDMQDGKVFHSESFRSFDGKTVLSTRVEADIVIGSGQLGKSYLCMRDGSVWQTGISWFSTKNIWDISPGFTPGRHATRSVVAECLYCHVNQVEPIPGTINRYKEPLLGKQAAIGCERCHGPGQLHVAERLNAKDTKIPDTSIVNPKHLEPALRDAICQQCHLQGEERATRRGRDIFEYRPGLPLEAFQAIFVKPPESVSFQKSVGQVEQLRSSRCSVASEGKMSCTSCHDPHSMPTPENKEKHYRQACLKCHTERGCSAPHVDRQTKNDSCVRCHMATGDSMNIPHASVTDHRIRRKPGSTLGKMPTATALPFVLFHAESKHAPTTDERERDLGIALAKHLLKQGRQSRTLFDETILRLEKAVATHPSDAQAWSLLSQVRSVRGQWNEALADIEKARRITPNDESILKQAIQCSFAVNQPQKSLEYAQRAVTLNPGNIDNHSMVGNAYIELGDYKQAEAVFRKVIRMIPSWANAYAGLAICLHRLGNPQEARLKLELAVELDPERGTELREWFRQKTK